MPRVPTITDNRVQERGLPNQRFSVSTNAETFGAGAAKESVNSFSQYAIEERKKADQLAVLDADRQLSEFETNILYSSDKGVLNKKGKDAFGSVDYANQEFQKKVGEIEKGLSGDEQKLRFKQMANSRYKTINSTVQKHMASEAANYDEQVTTAYIANEQDAAALNYFDKDRVGLSLFRQQASLIEQKERNGLPEEWLKYKIGEAKSKTHTSVIERMLANDDYTQAQEYFSEHKDDIDSKSISSVEKALKVGKLRGDSQKKTDEIMASADTVSDGLARAREIEDPEIRDEVAKRVKSRFAEQKLLEKKDLDRLYLNAYEQLKQNPSGDPLDVIEPGVFSKLSSEQQKALYSVNTPGKDDENSWISFMDLNPKEMAGLSLSDFQTKYWSGMNEDHRKQATQLWNTAQKNQNDIKLKSILSNKERIKNSLVQSGLYNAEKASMEEKERLISVQNAVDKSYQEFQETKKRDPYPEEVQKMIDDELMRKVFVKRSFWTDPSKLRSELKEDEKGRAYVPYKKIPTLALEKIKQIASIRGKKLTKENAEKIYGATLVGDSERVEELLR